MNKLIADGRVIRGYIGIEARDINPVMARLYDAEQVSGIIVIGMDPNGPAAKAGFKVQDILIEIDGKKVTDRRNVLDIVTELRPGNSVEMKVLRNGQVTTLSVLIADEPNGY